MTMAKRFNLPMTAEEAEALLTMVSFEGDTWPPLNADKQAYISLAMKMDLLEDELENYQPDDVAGDPLPFEN